MRFSGWPSLLPKCLQFLLASGGVAVVHLRRGLWRVSVPWVLAGAYGFRFLLPRVRLAFCRLVLSRAAFPAPALAPGQRLLSRWGLGCLAPCFWGLYLFRRRGVCCQFRVYLGGLVVPRLLPHLSRQFSCHCFSLQGGQFPPQLLRDRFSAKIPIAIAGDIFYFLQKRRRYPNC